MSVLFGSEHILGKIVKHEPWNLCHADQVLKLLEIQGKVRKTTKTNALSQCSGGTFNLSGYIITLLNNHITTTTTTTAAAAVVGAAAVATATTVCV